MKTNSARTWQRVLLRCVRIAAVVVATVPVAVAQDNVATSDARRASGDGAGLTVRGTVVNAGTGQPVARALVRSVGARGLGALTDEAGRFAIHGVGEGVLSLTVTKQGFSDAADPDSGSRPGFITFDGNMEGHRVRVAEGMPDLRFSLVQNNVISGQVKLSNDLPAQDIQLALFMKSVESGQSIWRYVQQMAANPDGRFRQVGVRDGTYLLRSFPNFESGTPEGGCNAKSPAAVRGFPVRYVSDAGNVEGSEPIVVANGQTAEVNLELTLATFHLVQAKLTRLPAGPERGYSVTLLDGGGRESAYQFFLQGETLCAYLPDGSYTLAVSRFLDEPERSRAEGSPEPAPKQVAGSLGFTVEGQPLRELRLVVAPTPSTKVVLHYEPEPPPHAVVKVPANGRMAVDDEGRGVQLLEQRIDDSARLQVAVSQAFPTGENTLELPTQPAGAYRIRALVYGNGICLGAVTAGGENMARLPWVGAAYAAGPPVEVQVRTDCASLTVNLPSSLPAEALGEGTILYVYLVPAFDSTMPLPEARLDQFGERTVTLKNLTPGAYRLFAFRKPKSIDSTNSQVLEQLGPGQPVTLEPKGTATLTVEDTPR